MLLCEVAVGIMIKYNFDAPGNDALGSAIIALICIYVAGFAWSWGPLGWLVGVDLGGCCQGSGGQDRDLAGAQAGIVTVASLGLPAPINKASILLQVPSEIQRFETRGAGMAVATFTNYM